MVGARKVRKRKKAGDVGARVNSGDDCPAPTAAGGCRHRVLTAIEDRAPWIRWRCDCGWWTDSMKGAGQQVGDKCVVTLTSPSSEEAAA